MAAAKTVIVIVGPTASGKSAIAHKLARKYKGAILSADARTVYRYADIGTAKPTKTEQQEVQYYGLNIRELGQPFTAHDFQQYAQQVIKDCERSSKQLIIVGGSGLYIDSVIYDFTFRIRSDDNRRQSLNAMTVTELQNELKKENIPLPQNMRNPRHLIRTLETNGQIPKRGALRTGFKLIGVLPADQVLKARIKRRIEHMFMAGFADEVKKLLDMYPEETVSQSGIGYQVGIDYMRGKITLEQAVNSFAQGDWRYARRQKTWFRRNKDIQWFDDPNNAMVQAEHYIKHKQ